MKNVLHVSTIVLSLSVLSCQSNSEKSKTPETSERIVQEIELGSADGIIEVDNRDTFSQALLRPIDGKDLTYSYRCEPEQCPNQLNVSPDGVLTWNKAEDSAGAVKSFGIVVNVNYSLNGQNFSNVYRYTIWPGNHVYQNGDQWSSSKPYEVIDNHDLTNLAQIVGHGSNRADTFNIGTAFYLGQFAGEHLVATAKHVAARDRGLTSCDGERNIVFTEVGVTATCRSNIFTTSPYDFIIMSVTFSDARKAELLKSSTFKLNRNLKKSFNQPLAIAGFGRFRSRPKQVHLSYDSDCRGMSDDDLRPTNNIENYPVVACDASPGDSGAPILDLESREIIGLIQGATSSSLPRVESKVIQDFLQLRQGMSEDIGRTVYIPTSYVLKDLEERILSGEVNNPSLIELLGANP